MTWACKVDRSFLLIASSSRSFDNSVVADCQVNTNIISIIGTGWYLKHLGRNLHSESSELLHYMLVIMPSITSLQKTDGKPVYPGSL